jgi:alpha-N-arabinofuranosidase
VPNLQEHRWPTRPTCDHFDGDRLDVAWNFLRTPREPFWSLTARPGHLRLQLRPARISDLENPSFVGRRQQHMAFTARTAMDFMPAAPNEAAGLVLLQNNDFHMRLVCTLNDAGAPVVRLIQRLKGEENVIGEQPVAAARIYLKVEVYGQDYSFYVATEPEVAGAWSAVAEHVDGRLLSTPVAGGFVGAYVGLYASANGHYSTNVADFDWFEYKEITNP